jgi:hypothetical protein
LARFNDRPGILGDPNTNALIVDNVDLKGFVIALQKQLGTKDKQLNVKQRAEVTPIALLSTSHNCTVFFVCILDY